MITHYDLFAGIGGFSLALDEVYCDETIKHIFCEWEQFPTAVLKKHWPEGIFYGDIADLIADTECEGRQRGWENSEGQYGQSDRAWQDQIILTGGFPCQPFSQAGRRRGIADDRYKWPEMYQVIRNVKPNWIIAENVRGLVTWNDGLVLETVCADLESEGYEVQPLIIPAVAVNAPHRRDRIWVIGHAEHNGKPRTKETREDSAIQSKKSTRQKLPKYELARDDSVWTENPRGQTSTNTRSQRWKQRSEENLQPQRQEPRRPEHQYPDWQRNWQEVAFATCDDGVDDGLSRIVDGVPYSRAKWRKESLKAYGNSIVPQVAIEIFKAIKLTAPTGNKE